MDWFGTTIQENNFIKNNLLQFPSHVLELWECKKCLNVIYQKKSNFSPFDSKPQFRSTINLENVLIKLTQSPQFNNHQPHTNEVHVYCKTCPEELLLAQLIPQIDSLKHQFTYHLTPKLQNIQKSKIFMGKNNFYKLAQTQSKINPVQNQHSLSIHNQVKNIKKDIQTQMMLWYQSKNFNIYEAFVLQSEKKRKQLDFVKNFMVKMNPNLKRKEQNEKKILKNRQRVSNSLLSESSVSYGE